MWKKKLSETAAAILLSACFGYLPQAAFAAPVIANMPHRADGSKITAHQQTPGQMPADLIVAGKEKSQESPQTPVPAPKTAAAGREGASSAAPRVTAVPRAAQPVLPPARTAAEGPASTPPPAPSSIKTQVKPAAPAPTAKAVLPDPAAPSPKTEPKPTKPLKWEQKIKTAVPAKNPEAAPAEAKSVYQVGDKGWKVKQAQLYLQKLGFNPEDTDGRFTKSTRKALRKFQEKYKLKVTGNLDNATYEELKWQIDSKEYGGNVESIKILKTAARFRGVPYVWGGTTPKGFDCSGFVQYVFAQNGIRLTRTADTQALEGKHIAKKDLKPGDLVFFSTYEPGASHDGIYAGNGKFWNATSSRGVMLCELNDSYWGPRYYTARRILRSNGR